MDTDNEHSFSEVLSELDSGDTEAELTRCLRDVVKAVIATRKGGKVTVSMDIKPGGKENAVTIQANVTHKIPTRAKDQSIFWATQEGGVTRVNPNQPVLKGVTMVPAKVVDIKPPLKSVKEG